MNYGAMLVIWTLVMGSGKELVPGPKSLIPMASQQACVAALEIYGEHTPLTYGFCIDQRTGEIARLHRETS